MFAGLSIPILPGITPGSGPGHLGLFGYDPLDVTIGRGVLEALGIDLELGPHRRRPRGGNFCTVDEAGRLVDRRAGRIPTEVCAKQVEKLRQIRIPGIELVIEPVREYRFAVVFKGEGLFGDVNDTDPQVTGVPALEPKPRNPESGRMASIAAEFIRQAAEILQNDRPANMLMLRGFARKPPIASMEELYGVRAAAIAVYPMYRGLARLVGMNVLPAVANLAEQVEMLRQRVERLRFLLRAL